MNEPHDSVEEKQPDASQDPGLADLDADDEERTKDHARGDDLELGMKAGFGSDSTSPSFPGGSVLKAMSLQLSAVPRIHLHESDAPEVSPVARPFSSEMPTSQVFPERYQMVGEIARGGMGAIFKGRDKDLGRDIAVKLMLHSHGQHEDLVQRFIEEAQVGGQLQHPGIVPVYELGQAADRRPYFTMKLVTGRTLAALLKERSDPHQDLPRFLGIFEQVCQTMAYAHVRGVIHRDLKPANIMVGAFGEVQVMDWGLAKIMPRGGIADEASKHPALSEEANTLHTIRSQGSTQVGQKSGSATCAGKVLGTPAYMAPEQARGEVDSLDERCDVFGLGGILCVILTGQPPYPGEDGAEVLGRARAANLGDTLARLDNCGADKALMDLTRRCLAVKPEERLHHAGQVAARITEYQESVQSRMRRAEIAEAEANARTLEERKRRRVTLVLGSVVVTVLLLLLAGGWYFNSLLQDQVAETKKRALAEEKAKNKAIEAAKKLEHQLYISDMRLAHADWQNNNINRLVDLLHRHHPKNTSGVDRRGFEWHYLWRLSHSALLSLDEHEEVVVSVAYSPDGMRIVSGDRSGVIKIWDAESGKEVLTLKGHGKYVRRVAYHPNGTRIVSGGDDGLIKVWEAATGKKLLEWRGHDKRAMDVTYDAEGRRIIAGGPAGLIKVWDAGTGKELLTIKGPERSVSSLAGSPDGNRIIVGGFDGSIRVWDALKGNQLIEFKGHLASVNKVVCSPDGKHIASSGGIIDGGRPLFSGDVKVWDTETGKHLLTLDSHTSGFVVGLAYSPDGKQIAGISHDDRILKVWDAITGKLLFTRHGQAGPAQTLAYRPDGKRIVVAGGFYPAGQLPAAGEIKVWPAKGISPRLLDKCNGQIVNLGFAGDGKLLFCRERSGEVTLWDLASGKKRFHVQSLAGQSSCIDFSPDGKRILVGVGPFGAGTGELKMWDLTNGREVFARQGLGGLRGDAEFSPDGEQVLYASGDSKGRGKTSLWSVRVWDIETGKEVFTLQEKVDFIFGAAYSPDGKHIFMATGALYSPATIKVLEAKTGRLLRTFKESAAGPMSMNISPDGKRILLCASQTVKALDSETGKELYSAMLPMRDLFQSWYSVDGKRIIAQAFLKKQCVLYDAETGQELLTLKDVGELVVLSPDGLQLASVAADSSILIWDARANKTENIKLQTGKSRGAEQ